MMDQITLCYIPGFIPKSLLVVEKKNIEGFLPSIGVAAMLVIWPRYSLLAKKIHSNVFYLTSLFGAITFALIFPKFRLHLSYTALPWPAASI